MFEAIMSLGQIYNTTVYIATDGEDNSPDKN